MSLLVLLLCSIINQHTYRQKLLILISNICLFSILILICYIFSTNKVLEIRLVVLIPLTTIQKFNWQLCLKLTDPNFAWFNSQSTKKVPTLGLAFSYLRTSVLSVFYDCHQRWYNQNKKFPFLPKSIPYPRRGHWF